MNHAKRLAVLAPEKKPDFGVAQPAGAIAQEMELPEDEIYCIHFAGVIHDLGEISIAAEILTKRTTLTALELQMVRMHARVGYDIIKGVMFSYPVAQFVLQHHERMDGSGHPWGLRGPGILLGAKILAVADTVEAMSSHRPCRRGFGMDAAHEQITKHRGRLYDADVVDACLKLFREEQFAFETYGRDRGEADVKPQGLRLGNRNNRDCKRNRFRIGRRMMNAVALQGCSALGATMRAYGLKRALFAAVGFGAVLALAFPTPHEVSPRQIVPRSAPGAAASAEYSARLIEEPIPAPGAAVLREQAAVAAFITRRYRVAGEAVPPFVVTAYLAGEEFAVDPLLILAVIAVESGFNPAAESVVGAKGLMQVMAKFHMEKVALYGDHAVLLEPDANIRIGTQILREYLRRSGEIVTALQMYVGAVGDPDSVYARKVLAERSRIEQALIRLRHAA